MTVKRTSPEAESIRSLAQPSPFPLSPALAPPLPSAPLPVSSLPSFCLLCLSTSFHPPKSLERLFPFASPLFPFSPASPPPPPSPPAAKSADNRCICAQVRAYAVVGQPSEIISSGREREIGGVTAGRLPGARSRPGGAAGAARCAPDDDATFYAGLKARVNQQARRAQPSNLRGESRDKLRCLAGPLDQSREAGARRLHGIKPTCVFIGLHAHTRVASSPGELSTAAVPGGGVLDDARGKKRNRFSGSGRGIGKSR